MECPHVASQLPRQVLAYIGLAALLCSQAIQLLVSSGMEANPELMQTPSGPATDDSRPAAHWNPAEITHMLEYLQSHKSEIGEAGIFKMKTFTDLLPTLAPLRTSGAIKTTKHCASKWAAVSFHPCHFLLTLIVFFS